MRPYPFLSLTLFRGMGANNVPVHVNPDRIILMHPASEVNGAPPGMPGTVIGTDRASVHVTESLEDIVMKIVTLPREVAP